MQPRQTTDRCSPLHVVCLPCTLTLHVVLIRTGDLGTSPKEVETKLQEAFQLAQLWNCVLLLDEADVFLAQRSEDDIQRNALVSGKSYCVYVDILKIVIILTLVPTSSLPPRSGILRRHPLPHEQPSRRL